MKDEKRGIIISLIIWVLLMFMTLTRWMGDGTLKEIGDTIQKGNDCADKMIRAAIFFNRCFKPKRKNLLRLLDTAG